MNPSVHPHLHPFMGRSLHCLLWSNDTCKVTDNSSGTKIFDSAVVLTSTTQCCNQTQQARFLEYVLKENDLVYHR